MIHYHIKPRLNLGLHDTKLDVHDTNSGLHGTIMVPGDKSISHRAVMLTSLADGVSTLRGLLLGEDVKATMAAFRALGVTLVCEGTECTVYGVGLFGLTASDIPLDMGNSGTAMRLLAGLLAGQSFDSTLIGDASLTRRPMRRVVDPLREMGASIQLSDAGTAPIEIFSCMHSVQQNDSSNQHSSSPKRFVAHTTTPLCAINYTLPVASAQVKSCVLLAGLYAQGETRVTEPVPTRDHTERMLTTLGYPVTREGQCIALSGGHRLNAADIQVPGDISSAAFFMVAATIVPGSDVVLRGVGVNPTRTGVIDILKAMGADLDVQPIASAGAEPMADIRVRSAVLRGISIPHKFIASAIDEFPVLFIAAACATGETVLTGAEELRVKETDRIAAMADGLQRLGISTEVLPDGIKIQGGLLQGGRVRSYGDHRIAMAFAVAGARAHAPVIVEDCANVATSFPNFVELAKQVGLPIDVVSSADHSSEAL